MCNSPFWLAGVSWKTYDVMKRMRFYFTHSLLGKVVHSEGCCTFWIAVHFIIIIIFSYHSKRKSKAICYHPYHSQPIRPHFICEIWMMHIITKIKLLWNSVCCYHIFCPLKQRLSCCSWSTVTSLHKLHSFGKSRYANFQRNVDMEHGNF